MRASRELLEQLEALLGRGAVQVVYGALPAAHRRHFSADGRLVGTLARFMALHFLDFEQPIAELEAKIEELKSRDLRLRGQYRRRRSSGCRPRAARSRTSIFANLSPWQITQLARHPQRPYTLDYVSAIFTDLHELHGDRMYADDLAIVGGLARLEGAPVMIIGHQKGRDTKERVRRNYGMPKPEGYRKALRLMRLAERFGLPLITLIDTPGAYPGVGSEERGQSEAIARNLFEMSHAAASRSSPW